jgi:hypothetical protein
VKIGELPIMSIENPTLAHFRHFSSLFTNLPAYKAADIYVPIRHTSTFVENPLQIHLFMQNKPNFKNSQMNLKSCNTIDYENKSNWTLGENKPNSNPIKPNSKPISKKPKMNVNLTLTKDYRKKDDFSVRINKPKTNHALSATEGVVEWANSKLVLSVVEWAKFDIVPKNL